MNKIKEVINKLITYIDYFIVNKLCVDGACHILLSLLIVKYVTLIFSNVWIGIIVWVVIAIGKELFDIFYKKRRFEIFSS